MISEVYNVDCMEYMRTVPDGYFALAVVDPPYGIHINESIGRRAGEKHSGRKKALWDAAPPPPNILTSLKGYRATRLFGAQITLLAVCRGIAVAGLCGIKSLATALVFRNLSLPIPLLDAARKSLINRPAPKSTSFTQRKNPLSFTNGFTGFSLNPATGF